MDDVTPDDDGPVNRVWPSPVLSPEWNLRIRVHEPPVVAHHDFCLFIFLCRDR